MSQCLLAAAVVLAAAAAPLRAWGPQGGAADHPLGEILTLLRSGDPEDQLRCRKQLDDLARAAAPALVAALLDPAALCGEHGTLVDGRARGLLLEALRALPDGALDGILADLPGEHASAPQRLRSIELLGELGGVRSVDPLLARLGDLDPVLRQNDTVREILEAALAGLLVRHEDAYALLAGRLEGLPVDLQCVLARAVGRARSGRGLTLLGRLLHLDPRVDRAVLEAVGELDPADPACLQGECAAFASWYLDSSDSEARRLAITVLGVHGGALECGRLIPLFSSDTPEVRHAARWALGRISGRDWGPGGEGAARWERWFAAELAWYETRSPGLLAAALGDEPAQAFAALGELSSHGVFRRELAADLEPVLLEAEALVAAHTCAALARLGGPAGLALLTRASGDRRPPVAEAAAAALEDGRRP